MLRQPFWGSPPPMRGKGDLWIAHLRPAGITPAYAGKSGRRKLYYKIQGDHPRLCGEKSTRDIYSRYGLGSPPPMRGKGTCNADAY